MVATAVATAVANQHAANKHGAHTLVLHTFLNWVLLRSSCFAMLQVQLLADTVGNAVAHMLCSNHTLW
jgi:hypothetical protein